MQEHDVHAHLGVAAASYDAQIRIMVPHYDAMHAAVVRWLRPLPDDAAIVDLGAGTGALAEAVLTARPRARLILVDADPAMLEVARGRLAAHAARVELRRASFDDPLPPCHAVVASLALHHVRDASAKRSLFRRIHQALPPGGALWIADATVPAGSAVRAGVFDDWAAWMVERGVPEAEARRRFDDWAREDTYHPLEVELGWLREAGFPHPDCVFRQGVATVYGGFRQ